MNKNDNITVVIILGTLTQALTNYINMMMTQIKIILTTNDINNNMTTLT